MSLFLLLLITTLGGLPSLSSLLRRHVRLVRGGGKGTEAVERQRKKHHFEMELLHTNFAL
jgi:hypothetical protein